MNSLKPKAYLKNNKKTLHYQDHRKNLLELLEYLLLMLKLHII